MMFNRVKIGSGSCILSLTWGRNVSRVASQAAFGTPGIDLGTLTVTATSVASVAQVGAITVALMLTITPEGVVTAAQVGTPQVSLELAGHIVNITADLVEGPAVTAQLSTPLGVTAQLVGHIEITKA